MRLFPLIVALAIPCVASGCARPDPVATNAKPVNLPLPSNASAPDPAGAPPENRAGVSASAAAPTAAASPSATIPSKLLGQWGLTPADCLAPNGSGKGLLVVSSGELRFHDSSALPSPDVQTDPSSVGGDFRFTGEGEAWTKYEALQRNGDKLTRTETNPAASYTYAKC